MAQTNTVATSALPGNKLLGLEVLRFLAALAVLFYHYRHFAAIDGELPSNLQTEDFPFHKLFWPFYDDGLRGVWVFWCISGFIFFWKYREQISKGAVDSKSFFVLRFSRLYPLHLVTLLAVAALQAIFFYLHGQYFIYLHNELWRFILQIFFASNWGQDTQSFDGPIWSISVEVLAYLIFFLTLRFVSKSVLVNVFVVATCIGLRAHLYQNQIVDCLAFFYVGGLAALARKWVEGLYLRKAIHLVSWMAACIIPVVMMTLKLYQMQRTTFPFFILYTPGLLFCISGSYNFRLPVQRFIEAAGNMTYASYLLHFPIQLMIALLFSIAQRSMPLGDTVFFALFFGATLVASRVCYRYLELPAQITIRQRFL